MTATKNLRIAKELQRRIAAIPGVADAHLQQEVNAPEFFAEIDRARASQFGLTVSDIAPTSTSRLSSSEQVSPNFWTDPTNGIPYYLAVQTPEHTGWLRSTTSRTRRSPRSTVAQRRSGAGPAQQRRDAHARLRSRPTPTRPTSSRSTRSTPTPTAAISARSRATSTRSWPD